MLTSKLAGRPILATSWPLAAAFTALLIGALTFDEELFFLLNQMAAFQPLFWLHLTHLGEVLVAVATFGIFVGTHPRLLWSLAISIILSVLIVQGLKHVVAAPRPPAVLAVDQIQVIVPTTRVLHEADPNINYEDFVNSRPDYATSWQKIQSDPNSREARYWIPRMSDTVTKEQFGIALYHETLDLERGTYIGIYRPSVRSFPSGHTATIACALSLLMVYFGKLRYAWGLALLAVAVGGSRVVVGVHWPLDVAVGGLVGWTVAIAGTWLAYRWAFTSKKIGHWAITLLPIAAALTLLAREPVYPEIAVFETLIGVGSLALTAAGLWRLYTRKFV